MVVCAILNLIVFSSSGSSSGSGPLWPNWVTRVERPMNDDSSN